MWQFDVKLLPTLREARAFYKRTGMAVISGEWLNLRRDCCCFLSAVAMERGCPVDDEEIAEYWKTKLHNDILYGITSGFDVSNAVEEIIENPFYTNVLDDRLFRLGLKLGKVARRVFLCETDEEFSDESVLAK